MTDEAAPFPIVVGRGRSGTTMLRSMLDAHPLMAVPPESHFLASMGLRRRRYERGTAFAVERFVFDLEHNWGFKTWGLPRGDVVSALTAPPPRDYPAAVRRVFGAYAARQGKPRYGDKTPIYVLHLPLLARLFPEARFVHIIRDGRDVALSYLDTDFGPSSVGAAALYWLRFVEKGRSDGRALGPTRYHEMRYEDLLRDPERALRSLCAFIGLPFDRATLRYFENADRHLQGISHREHHRRLYLPPTAGLRDWRRDMSPAHVALFDAIAGDLLEALGYERGTGRPDLRTRLEARWYSAAVMGERVNLAARRAFRSTRRRFQGVGPGRGTRLQRVGAVRDAGPSTVGVGDGRPSVVHDEGEA